MDRRQAQDLDNYITGHYGEDQYRDEDQVAEETMAITGRRPTLTDCGCEATVYADGSGIELHYCPMHQAAPQLLEALREFVQAEQEYTNDPDAPTGYRRQSARVKARSAIAAAGGMK